VQAPVKFELVIDMKAAEAVGLDMRPDPYSAPDNLPSGRLRFIL
jgi:hypothetical protein